MPETDFHTPNTVEQAEFVGDSVWSDLPYAKNLDGQFTYSEIDKTAYSYTLFLTNYNFTTENIPANSNIDGVAARIWRKAAADGSIYDVEVNLWRAAGVEGLNLASGIRWPTVNTAANYGGETNKWNVCDLTDEEVRGPSFGIRFLGFNDGVEAVIAYIDTVLIKIYYSAKEAVAGGPCISLSNRLSVP